MVGLVFTVAHPAAALDDLRRYVFVPGRSTSEVAIIDTESDELETALRRVGPCLIGPCAFALEQNTKPTATAKTTDARTLARDLIIAGLSY